MHAVGEELPVRRRRSLQVDRDPESDPAAPLLWRSHEGQRRSASEVRPASGPTALGDLDETPAHRLGGTRPAVRGSGRRTRPAERTCLLTYRIGPRREEGPTQRVIRWLLPVLARHGRAID